MSSLIIGQFFFNFETIPAGVFCRFRSKNQPVLVIYLEQFLIYKGFQQTEEIFTKISWNCLLPDLANTLKIAEISQINNSYICLVILVIYFGKINITSI